MKFRLLIPLAAAVFFSAGHSTRAQSPGYQLTVEWRTAGGLVSKVEAPGLLLDSHSVTLPIDLKTSKDSTERRLIVHFDFDFQFDVVNIELRDPSILVTNKESSRPLEIFEGTCKPELDKPVTIFTNNDGTLSFTLNAPEGRGSFSGPAEIPVENTAKIESEIQVRDGRIHGTLYNPTEYRIESVQMRVTAEKTDAFAGFDRIYEDRVHCDPLESESFQIEAKLPRPPEGVDVKVTLEKAFGVKTER